MVYGNGFGQKIIVIVLLLVCGVCQAVELGQRYIDPGNGFSLRPPAGADTIKSSGTQIVIAWEKRDPAGKAIEWKLSVVKYESPDGKSSFAKFAADIKKSAMLGNLKIQDIKVTDKQVILSGTTTGRRRFFQKRAWFNQENGRMVELRIDGPAGKPDDLVTVFDAVYKTFEATNPKKNVDIARKNLKAGQRLLNEISARGPRRLLRPGKRFFLYKRNSKPSGYMIVNESAAGLSGRDGIKCEFDIRIDSANSSLVIQREVSASFDRQFESWAETVELKSGDKVRGFSQIGSKKGELIESAFIQGDQKKKNPPINAPKESYLPKAMELMIYRALAGKTTGDAYAFAVYDSTKNIFNIRTFRHQGIAEIKLGQKSYQAIRAEDQVDINKSPAEVFLDQKGAILNLQAGGLTMERSSLAEITKYFPKAGK